MYHYGDHEFNKIDNSSICKNNIRYKLNYLLNPKKRKISGVNYSLLNFKEWDILLFITSTVDSSILLTQFHFNNIHLGYSAIDTSFDLGCE